MARSRNEVQQKRPGPGVRRTRKQAGRDDDWRDCPRIDCRRKERCLGEPCARREPPSDPY